jgi:uroporphyrin-III C-methyltransferase/precorrin-2 dehydrogenase/sirohydrochlorin ferrochelatase
VILLGLSFAGKRVVIAGGGAVATRRAQPLVADGAHVVVIAPDISEGIRDLVARGAVTVEERTVRAADVPGAWLVVAATDNPTVNEQLASWAEENGAFCINASDAVAGSARMAAQSVHGDFVLGVASLVQPDPARVRAIRDDLAEHVDSGAISLRARRSGAGRVVLVGAGPGAEDLITVRGARALATADVVVHDRLGTAALLDRLSEGVEIIDVGKQPDNHPVPQRDINRLLVERAVQGKVVVRLKGGDPFVLGRGGEEVEACIAAGVSVEVVPGLTSAIAGPAAALIPVTDRSVKSSLYISTAHAGLDEPALAAMRAGSTVVLLMGVAALAEVVETALAEGIATSVPVAIIENATLPEQRVTHARLDSIVRISNETQVKSPAVIVIGEVAREGFIAHRDAHMT